MNRTEWQACNDPALMLRWAIERGASERKLRLFMCAWLRRVTPVISTWSDQLQKSLDEAEAQADRGAIVLSGIDPGTAARSFIRSSLEALAEPAEGQFTPQEAQAARADLRHLLHDLFDDLFRPAPLFLAWLDGHPHVEQLARGIMQSGAFADLPVLADALEEAGCTDEELLEHSRHHPLHARGCWALDAILGRG